MPRSTDRRPLRAWTRRLLVAAVFLAAVSWPLWAGPFGFAGQQPPQQGQQQQQQPPDEAQLAEMMKKYEEAARPAKFHEALKPLEGEWNVTAETLTPTGTMTSTGYSKNTWMMGNRFLRQEFNGNMMGREFHGVGFTGYDNTAGKYQTVWMDEMSTGMFYADGEATDDGRTITFTGEGADPMTGQVKSYRHVSRLIDNDNYVFEMYEPGPSGEMTRVVTLNYKRAKGPEQTP